MITNLAPVLHPSFLDFVRPAPHSTFSPSGADRWLITGCPFSVKFCQGIPEEENDYSTEGTFAHSVCEAVFREAYYFTPFPAELKAAIEMWEMEDLHKRSGSFRDMLDHAHTYVEVISYYLANKEVIGDVVHVWLEKGVPVYAEEGCFGTADCIIVGTKASAVIDFKYGKGKNVKADTVQLKVYAAGLARHMDVKHIPGYKIFAVIHQPRTDVHPKEHSYEMPELYEFLNVIWESIQAANSQGLEPKEGNHCFWCPAKRTKDNKLKCPAILGKAVKLANERFDMFMADMNAPVANLTDPNTKRDEAIIKIMALYPLLKQVAEDGQKEFQMRLLAGEAIPGVRLVDDFGNRALNGTTDEEKAQLILSKFPGVEVFKEIPATKKLKTITELEKELGKNKLEPLCVRKITKIFDVLDEKTQAILKDLSAYAMMINNGQGQEE